MQYPYEVIGHKSDEMLPVACVDKDSTMGVTRAMLDDGFTVVTVRERIGETNQFRIINHIDIRWMDGL